jgi:hypothetical protein
MKGAHGNGNTLLWVCVVVVMIDDGDDDGSDDAGDE